MCDATAIVEYLLRTPFGQQVATIIEAPDVEIHVPALCDVEVTAVLRQLEDDRPLRLYLDLPLWRHGHQHLVGRVRRLGDFSPYDAPYVALAERLRATLITGDAELTRAARRLDLNVIGVG